MVRSRKTPAAPKVTDIDGWNRTYQANLATMELDFQTKDLRMVVIEGLPENDQCWIDTCTRFSPLCFGGNLGTCWLYFETSRKAFEFASATYGKAFKGHPMQVSGTHLTNLQRFEQLIAGLKKIASDHYDTLEYVLRLSETEKCKTCGDATYVRDP